MAAIVPIVTTRTSDQLLQQRLLSQFDYDKKTLSRLQDQVSTGYRLSNPSDDAPAALRALTLQRLMEQKSQATTNLQTTQSYLSASESALGSVSDHLITIRGQALAMVSTITGDSQRRAAAFEVRQSINQLTSIANQQFRGRYLFAGSKTATQPFVRDDQFLAYVGNEMEIASYPDVNLLFESNISGQAVFGTYSPGVQSNIDLQANLTENTRLSELNGGRGVTPGSLRVSDGFTESIVDVSNAETIGDVMRLLESNPPAGRFITVRISGRSLVVDMDDQGLGTLTIQDVSGGTIAAELGILENVGSGVLPLIGQELDPLLTLTTPIAELFGTRAVAYLASSGSDNDIAITALERGNDWDGYAFQLVDDSQLQAAAGLSAGSETVTFSATAVPARTALTFTSSNNNLLLTANIVGTAYNNVAIEITNAGLIGNAATVTYDATARRLSIGIDSANGTQIQTVINAIQAEGTFSASYDASDPTDGGLVPTAVVPSADIGNISGNTTNSGGAANTYFIHVEAGVSNALQVQNALQANADFNTNFTAVVEGKDTSTPPFEGLGALDSSATAVTSGGSGGEPDLESGIRIVNGGRTFSISFEDADTVEDILNTLNSSGANVLAEITEQGTGIRVRSRLSGSDFQIGENGGSTAETLGIRSLHRDTTLSELNYGRGVSVAESGSDFTITRKDGTQIDISLASAITIGDVLDTINAHPSNLNPSNRVVARLVQVGNGIELYDANLAGAGTLTIERGGSSAAEELGLMNVGDSETVASAATPSTARITFEPPGNINNALSITATQTGAAYNDVVVEFRNSLVGNLATVTFDGVAKRLIIDVDTTATSANTVLAAINTEGTFSATLDTTDDPSNDGSGLISQTGDLATTEGGSDESIQGTDVNPLEVEGMFNSLIRLEQAVSDFDLGEIERTLQLLGEDFERLNFARADIGHRERTLDNIKARLVNEDIELKSTLSNEIEVDLVQAISDLTARQANLQATLSLTGRMLQLNLLEFL